MITPPMRSLSEWLLVMILNTHLLIGSAHRECLLRSNDLPLYGDTFGGSTRSTSKCFKMIFNSKLINRYYLYIYKVGPSNHISLFLFDGIQYLHHATIIPSFVCLFVFLLSFNPFFNSSNMHKTQSSIFIHHGTS